MTSSHIERILARIEKGDQVKYLVQLKEYNAAPYVWVDRKDMNCSELLDTFDRGLKISVPATLIWSLNVRSFVSLQLFNKHTFSLSLLSLSRCHIERFLLFFAFSIRRLTMHTLLEQKKLTSHTQRRRKNYTTTRTNRDFDLDRVVSYDTTSSRRIVLPKKEQIIVPGFVEIGYLSNEQIQYTSPSLSLFVVCI